MMGRFVVTRFHLYELKETVISLGRYCFTLHLNRFKLLLHYILRPSFGNYNPDALVLFPAYTCLLYEKAFL